MPDHINPLPSIAPPRRHWLSGNRAWRYALIYLICGLFWVLGTDGLFEFFGASWFAVISASKGVAFVVVTAWLFYTVLRSRDVIERAALSRHYDYIIKYANDIFLLADEDLRVVDANDSAVAAYGYARDRLIGRSIQSLRSAQSRPFQAADFTRYVDSGVLFETEQQRADGSTFPVEVSARSIVIEGRRFYQGIIRDISARKQTERHLQYMNSLLKTQQQTSPDAILLVDENGHIVSHNRQFVSLFHVSGKLAEGPDDGPLLRYFVGEVVDPEAFLARVKYLYEHREEKGHDEIVLKDGRIIERDSSAVIGEQGFYFGRVWYFRDITAIRRYEGQLLAKNRALQVLSECNASLVRATDEVSLLEQVCGILTTVGGYALAWVAYLDGQRLVPRQISFRQGHPSEGVAWGAFSRADRAEDLAWRSIDAGATVWIQDVASEPASAWRDSAVDRDLGAMLDLPLKDDFQVFGVLVIGAEATNAFSKDEVALLEELGADLAFGIRGLRIRTARDAAMHAVNASEGKLRTVVESIADGIVMLDPGGVILFANAGAEKLLAHAAAPLVGTRFDFPLGDDALIALALPDGNAASIELTVAESSWDGKPARIVALHDITARHQIEAERQRHLQQTQVTLIQTIEAMAMMVEKRDPYTAGHQVRVADLAVAIGHEMGLPEQQLQGLRLGATIHDIGKISIPAEILNRPGKLGEHEFGLIRTHPEVGYDIVKNIDFIWPVKEMILAHHERIDGSGYPRGLKGNQIIIEARILAVADVVDAMSSHRPYRPALGLERAFEELRLHRGSFYDPAVVDACLRLFDEKRFAFDFEQYQAV